MVLKAIAQRNTEGKTSYFEGFGPSDPSTAKAVRRPDLST